MTRRIKHAKTATAGPSVTYTDWNDWLVDETGAGIDLDNIAFGTVATTGHVGIGYAALAASCLFVYGLPDMSTPGTGATYNALRAGGDIDFTTDRGNFAEGVRGEVYSHNTINAPTNTIIGVMGYAQHTETGTLSQVIGISAEARTSANAGLIAKVQGAVFQSSPVNASATEVYGTFTDSYLTIANGSAYTADAIYGHYVEAFAKASGTAGSSAIAANVYGILCAVHAKAAVGTTAHINNAYGLYLTDSDFNDPTAVAGTIDTWYGIYIDEPTVATTKYSIYSEGGTNYFGGKVLTTAGIGVGNSASATTLGNVTKKMQIFDAAGASLGYVPIYDAIT